jgi:hypothetical protein
MAVAAIFGIGWLHYYFTHASTDDVRVKGDLIAVISPVPDKIRLLSIQEGDRVEMGKFVHSGGMGFGWVSFLLKEPAIGENNHGAMIALQDRGRTNEEDTIAGYMFNDHWMCCP